MKYHIDHLELAAAYIKKNNISDWSSVRIDGDNLIFSFQDLSKQMCDIEIYPAQASVTPDITVKQKLYGSMVKK